MGTLTKAVIIIIVGVGAATYFFTKAPLGFIKKPQALQIFDIRNVLSPTSSFPFTPTLPEWNIQFKNSGFGYTVGSYLQSFSGGSNITYSRSPYFGKVKIAAVSGLFSDSLPSAKFQIQLVSYLYSGENLNITGWRIKGNKGDEIIIPQAINVYDYYSTSEGDIMLNGVSYVYIFSGTSPIARNLRLNKCTGYLNNLYTFNPPLPRSCPSLISRNEITHLAGFCQDIILSLGSCQVVSGALSNSLPGTNEGNDCRAFLNKISPRACFDKYRGNPDFLSNDWRIWFNRNIFLLDPRHDDVRLLDRQGLLVDEYIY